MVPGRPGCGDDREVGACGDVGWNSVDVVTWCVCAYDLVVTAVVADVMCGCVDD